MAEDPYDHDSEEFTSPHLPERYQRAVKAKRQRRLKHQVLVAGGVLVAIAALVLLFTGIGGGFFSGFSTPSPATGKPASTGTTPLTSPVSMVLSNTSDDFHRGPGLSGPLPAGAIPLDRAITVLRSDYPALDYSLLSADLTANGDRSLYTFSILAKTPAGTIPVTVSVDAITGSPYSAGEENAAIKRDDAKHRATDAIPGITADHVTLTYAGSAGSEKFWNFSVFSKGLLRGTGTLDAETGSVITFETILFGENRQQTPAIDSEQAEKIASRYIIDSNGGQLPLNMSRITYTPLTTTSGDTVAGTYTILYERTFQDYLTDVDGFSVTVDAITGDISGYTQSWTTPDHAFSASSDPEVVKREATFAVMQKAKEQYPDQIADLRILSAELRWKNKVPYGTVPRPGSIPLCWKVVFDDKAIRANATATPGIAWIDTQSGDFIAFEYRH